MVTNPLRAHHAPVFYTVEVSRDGGRSWQLYAPSAATTWTNPTTESYEASALGAQAEREGLPWVRCWQQEGTHGQPTLRWDASTLIDTDHEPAGLDDEGGFAPTHRGRR